MSVYASIVVWIYQSVSGSIHVRCMCGRINMCMCVCLCVCVCLRIHVCMYRYVRGCACQCMCLWRTGGSRFGVSRRSAGAVQARGGQVVCMYTHTLTSKWYVCAHIHSQPSGMYVHTYTHNQVVCMTHTLTTKWYVCAHIHSQPCPIVSGSRCSEMRYATHAHTLSLSLTHTHTHTHTITSHSHSHSHSNIIHREAMDMRSRDSYFDVLPRLQWPP